jgi:hypothetical protein
MSTYLPPSARMRQIKDAARANLAAASARAAASVVEPPASVAEPVVVAPVPTPDPEPEPVAEPKKEKPGYSISLKKADLLALAGEADVEIPENATKAQIVALLDNHFAG